MKLCYSSLIYSCRLISCSYEVLPVWIYEGSTLLWAKISCEDAILRKEHMNCRKIISRWQTYVLFPLAVNPLMWYIVFTEHMFCFCKYYPTRMLWKSRLYTTVKLPVHLNICMLQERHDDHDEHSTKYLPDGEACHSLRCRLVRCCLHFKRRRPQWGRHGARQFDCRRNLPQLFRWWQMYLSA